jgi:transcriptional regulator with XRE-family HTH domain
LDEDLQRIAARIRGWRNEAGLTLQKLGDRSGVSASTIHKIENLQTVPTIAILIKVANGLNRRPSELLEEIDVGKQVAILREKDRKRLSMSEHTELEQLIGMIPHNRFDIWRAYLKEGRGAGRVGTDAWRFKGEMVIFVEKGCLEVELGDEKHVIEVGDSIHFDTGLSHRWIAGRGEAATIIIVTMIPERLQADLISRASALGELSSLDGKPVGKAEAKSGDKAGEKAGGKTADSGESEAADREAS